jgi:hypothetical protein
MKQLGSILIKIHDRNTHIGHMTSVNEIYFLLDECTSGPPESAAESERKACIIEHAIQSSKRSQNYWASPDGLSPNNPRTSDDHPFAGMQNQHSRVLTGR